MQPPNHAIAQALFSLKLSSPEDLSLYSESTRDRTDIAAWLCKRSGVVLLSRIDHMDISHYETKQEFVFGQKDDRRAAIATSTEDSERRAQHLRPIVANRRWLDIGTGHGGILDLVSAVTSETVAVEPQTVARTSLTAAGYKVVPDVTSADGGFDVITLFHVFEHLTHPIAFLTEVRKKLKPGGILIIEVPHAKDALLTIYQNQAFKYFTLWSEHLLLHTRQSLTKFIEAAGFSSCSVAGIQRYPLANHLHWLGQGKPAGHRQWSMLRSNELDAAYAMRLAALDSTDTLLATIQ